MIYVLDIYKSLLDKLISFLSALSLKDWNRKTILPNWKVVDIAAHLLSGCIRKYSSILNYESGIIESNKTATYNSLVKKIYENNEKWVSILKNLNKEHIIELLNENYNKLILKFNELDPDKEAVHSVPWAGEDKSKNWFDIAREYTELWHHQMQIREAFNDLELLNDYYYYGVINTFFMALPFHYKRLDFKNNYNILIKIKNMENGNWLLSKIDNNFIVTNKSENNADNSILIDKSIAWKIFTKSISFDSSKSLITYNGNELICLHLLKMACIMI